MEKNEKEDCKLIKKLVMVVKGFYWNRKMPGELLQWGERVENQWITKLEKEKEGTKGDEKDKGGIWMTSEDKRIDMAAATSQAKDMGCLGALFLWEEDFG